MKAVICKRYGPPEVLQLQEAEKPIPKNNEVLIKIHASNVTVSDCIVRSGKINILLWLPMRIFVGFGKPRKPILGFDLAGEVEEIGKDVTGFRKGDQVFAFTGKYFGAFAEYVCLPEGGKHMPNDALITLKPKNISFEEAAAAPSRGTLALYFLKKGNIQSGQNILIYGASGGVGTYAIQLAKYFGAKVTGVASTANLELVKSLGADAIIDYTKEDVLNKGEQYDLIFDAVGNKKNSKFKTECQKLLTPGGKYISVDDGTAKISIEDLIFLSKLIEDNKIKTVVDKIYFLEQIADAHKYVEKGHKKGGVIISMK